MSKRTVQVIVVVFLLVFAIGCIVGTVTGNIKMPTTNTEQDFPDCDAEDWRTYDKDCGRKSPAPRRSTAPATKRSVIPGERA